MVAGTRAHYTVPKSEDDTVVKHDSAWTNTEAQPSVSFPDDVRKRYNENTHFGLKVDYSIFEFCRTGPRGTFRSVSGIDAGLLVGEDDSEEEVAAKRIALAVRDLKRGYKNAQVGGREKSFILRTSSRKLVPKVAY
jgi:hypothetical protein